MRDTLPPRGLGRGEVEAFHNLAAPRQRASGQAASDDLRHRAQICGDAGGLLRAARARSGPAHDFVEDEDHAAARRDLAQRL